jgi:folate-dependent phosphoribosylglycinamide formyltransferase PurN
LKAINPDLVIVNGTRIISKKVLSSINSKFVNIHVGITPKYRGVHGTYWALVNNDVENSGVTVHFVDELIQEI